MSEINLTHNSWKNEYILKIQENKFIDYKFMLVLHSIV